MSTMQIIKHYDDIETSKSNNIQSFGYEETYTEWTGLTFAEKNLAIQFPVEAAATISTRDKAYNYTLTNYGGHSGAGDMSDAFRHAVWNALMCKYISKGWAQLEGDAHEAQTEAYFNKVFPDGFTGRQHSAMDLHNNQKGRDCWSVLTDSMFWVSDGDLQNRVIAKINAGQMVTLHN